MHVLLVEDSPSDASLVTSFLTEKGNTVQCVQTLADALSADESNSPFDVVLLDLTLPDSDGIETVIKSTDYFEAPIIVLTGGDSAEGVATVKHGAEDYLVKDSIDAEVLGRSINYAIERKKLRVELETERERRLTVEEQAMFAKQPPQSHLSPRMQHLSVKVGSDYARLVVSYVHSLRTNSDRPIREVHNVVEALVAEQVVAQEIVGLHLASVQKFEKYPATQYRKALTNDARLCMIEILGHVLDQYQAKAKLAKNE